MASVDPFYAQWLQKAGLWVVRTDAGTLARWGDTAITAERMTSIALKADAVAEGDRQLAFMAGPHVIDEHLLTGEWRSYRGQVATLTIDQLGYHDGADVFVIGAEDDEATGLSKVTVIKRL